MRVFVYTCPDCSGQHEYGSPGAELYCGACIRDGRKVLLDRDYRAEAATPLVANLRGKAHGEESDRRSGVPRSRGNGGS